MTKKLHFAFLAALAGAAAAELPVREVVLYKHGVGYFLREGRLAPGESATLNFKAAEMNDVLKSLTIEEKGGGKVSGLRYDSSEPLEERLKEYPVSIGEKQTLAELLDQWKGARVELTLGSQTAGGVIVGARLAVAEEKRPEREQITLLLDSGDLRTFDLAAATGVRLPDPRLQSFLKDYLGVLAQSRSKERRSLYIDSTDARNRELKAGYLIPSPMWKSSYRLIFSAAGEPMLEGWAIVDNTTGEDWTNVRLALVSGRPISFVSNLYEPRYVERQTAELAEDKAQAPVVHRAGIMDKAPPPLPQREAVRAAGAAMMMQAADPSAPVSSIASTAVGRDLGELFEYRIARPVTVRRGESAMLPFLQEKAAGRKLLIYSGPASQHPTNAVELSNSTGKTLDGGPVTVFDAGAYAGEALMETLKAGDKRLISYGVDLGTRIATLFDSKAAAVRELKFRRGILTTTLSAVETKTYTIRNVDQKAKTLIVEHPARSQYTLVDRKPAETTATAYRFEVKLAPGATEQFPVTEERVYATTLSVANLTPDALLSYTQNKTLSAAAKRDLERIAAQKRKVAAVIDEANQVNAETSRLEKDQLRTRQNIASLASIAGQQQQVQTWAAQLASQDARLGKLQERTTELQRQRAALDAELNAMMESIDF